MRCNYIFLVIFLSMIVNSCDILDSGTEEVGLEGTIVFSARDDETGTHQIFTMRPDGSELRRLTDMKGPSVDPSWSPDGQQIVFSSFNQHTSAGPTLFLMDANGSNIRPLLDFEEEHAFPLPGNNPRWSPDGKKIAFDICINCQISTNYAIFVFDIETEEGARLTNEPAGYQSSHPKWSPDGTRIAFIANRDYVDADTLRLRRDLYIMDADGLNQTRVTETGFPGDYTWMNTDKILHTVTDRGTNLKSVLKLDVKTGNATSIMENLAIKNQFWVFWDPRKNRLLTINKNHEELPVTIGSYDLNGELLHRHQLNAKVMKSGLGYDWKINTK